MSLHNRFFEGHDFMRPTIYYVAGLLERGVRVLNYAGDVDWIANWHGNLQWTETLDWSGADEYQKAELRNWEVDGKAAGKYKRAGNLAFATISNAGHMVRCLILFAHILLSSSIRHPMTSQRSLSRCLTVGLLMNLYEERRIERLSSTIYWTYERRINYKAIKSETM
jgi:hypothetical protein